MRVVYWLYKHDIKFSHRFVTAPRYMGFVWNLKYVLGIG